MKILKSGLIVFCVAVCCRADTYLRQPSIDVVRYEISLELKDSSDVLTGATKIRIRMNKAASRMWLDFEDMIVDKLLVGGVEQHYEHRNGRLIFPFDRTYAPNEIAQVEVRYHGISQNGGMLIGKNRYGQRVFFSDNWPDRAHHWFPCVDHPSDKAPVDFEIITPEKYEVIANGRRIKTDRLSDGRKVTQWSEYNPIPTYCMAVGVAEFSIVNLEKSATVPIQFYAYPQDLKAAQAKFARTGIMLQFFSNLIGPYPYEKLAQVESTTSYGGMENASAIFYSESSFSELPISENPAPHEIAHQWFGDSVTESDWDHLWLSEGFATYFEALFYEKMEGPDALKRSMESAAKILSEYPAARSKPIIDPSLTDLMKKLNPINYQKGAWILHMLRGVLGDGKFFQGIRLYYRSFQNRTTITEDFRKAMETASGVDLARFFRQWLYQPGWLECRISWRWVASSGKAAIKVRQIQATGIYDMPLEIAFRVADRWEKCKIRVSKAAKEFYIPLSAKPSSLKIDPDGWMLKSVSIEAGSGAVE
jgi:aminopeptidase N